MISLGEMWGLVKAKPLLALFFLSLGGLIGCIIEAETRPIRCSSSDVRGYTYTVCSE